MPSPSFGDYRQYQWGLPTSYPLGLFEFLAEVTKKKWRCRVPHVKTIATTPNFNGLYQRSEGQNTSSFSFFREPWTDLPFCHSQPCHVLLFHLKLVKHRHMSGFVVWCSRACGEEVWFFLSLFCAYTVRKPTACSPTRGGGGGQDWQALDSVEFSKNMSHIERHELYLSMVCSCIYSKGFPLVFTYVSLYLP